MQEAMGGDSDDDIEEAKRPASKPAAKPAAKMTSYAAAVAAAAAAADATLAASPDTKVTTTKSGRKTKKKASEDGTPGKRKYVKRANWWGNRSGVNSPTAISRAKKEAEAIEAAKKAGKPLPVKKEAKPRRKYTKKSEYWKTNWDKKDGDGKEYKDEAEAKTPVPAPATSGKDRNSGAGTRKAPKKDTTSKNASSASSKPAAKKEPAPADEASDSDDSSVDLEAIVCCVCRCAVDYSDPDAFLPAPWVLQDKAEDEANKSDSSDSEDEDSDDEDDAEKNGDGNIAKSTDGEAKSSKPADSMKEKKKSDEQDEDSDEEEQFHPPLPHNLHDPNNGLLLCDGVGCNRAYHQRCHFVPVLSIPRGEWHCLICRVKEDMLGTSPTKGGKGKKKAGTRKKAKRSNSWDASGISSDAGSSDNDAGGLDPEQVEKELTISELDTLYRVDPPPRPKKGEERANETGADSIKQEPENAIDDEVEQARQKQLQESFELVSAPLKARILHTELTTKVKSVIDQSLSRIRQSENVIRAYTETSRARKSILDRYAMDGQVAQELVQALGKMAMAKQRIRGTLRSLEYIIKTNRSWEVDWLLDWITKEEQRVLAADSEEVAGADSANGLLENPGDIRALIFAKGLAKRRVEPRFESGSNEAILSIHGAPASNADHPPGAITTKTSGEEDELSIDHLTCVQCHLSTSCDDNDLLLCDGAGCFRAVHQKCVHPHVGQEDLHEDVDWFCPFCSALGEWVHYAQVEYLGDDYVDYQREKARRAKERAKKDRRRSGDGGEADDEESDAGNDSLASWEHPADVFPEADEEERVATRLRHGGKRNERTDRWLCELLGIPYGEDDGAQAMAQGDIEDDYDEEDDSDVTSVNSDDDSNDEGDDDDEDAASTISKSELNALSDYSSSDESSDEDSEGEDDEKKDKKRPGVRSSKRLRRNQERGQVVPTGRQAKQSKAQPNTALAALLRRSGYSGSGIGTGTGSESSSESEDEDKPDVGTLDESNIIVGKRQRTKVDYRKLNDAMFGSVDEDEAAKMFGKEEDEYNWAKKMSKKSRKRRSSSSSSSDSSSDEDSSNDEDSSDEEEDKGGDEKKKTNDLKPRAKAKAKADSSQTSKPKTKATPKKNDDDGPKRVSSRSTKGKKKSPPTPAKSSAKKSSKSGEPAKKKRKYTKRAGGYWSNRSGDNSPTAKSMARKAAAALASAKTGTPAAPDDASSAKMKRKATPAKTPDSSGAGSTSATKKRKYTKKSSPAKKKSASK